MDFNVFLVDHCLTKVDRASMAWGIEARVPFLDHELVETTFSIDHSIVYAKGERKSLLKSALYQHLPVGMDTNRKKGFSSPLVDWDAYGFGEFGFGLLKDGYLTGNNYLDPDKLVGLYHNSSSNIKILWISLELWARRWMVCESDSINDFSRMLASVA